MKPAPFTYIPAFTVEDAVAALTQNPDAKILAGGQSLIPMMNMRLAHPEALIDINPIQSLDGIALEGNELSIGALTRHRALETNPLIRQYCPLVAVAEAHVAHGAIRTRGTIGGSLSHADPAAELPLVFRLLDGRAEVMSPDGPRTVEAADFFMTFFMTALGPTDLLTTVRLPVLQPGEGYGFQEFSPRQGDFGLALAAVTLKLDENRHIQAVRLALGGVADVPLRLTEWERQLAGQPWHPATIREACQAISAWIEPPDDIHASAAYRTHLAMTLTERALYDAYRRITTPSEGDA
ncbi:molybdopterin dehydrogenase FAD-binding protein [Sulfobacillus acidophilus TPY]|uniref:Carbon-monoxide dehydrogenase (Acceptor) n=1 Tax=Sulfobacillus acidophilus (strain ATCC 700253 / DSM 10332 / NAL) TaxID=679936 RepID=G8TTA8_SULAD|nr:molybdopterin dehydrogenase FAD-binding protein [Sulfobacillus acidophilus TPY]AEW04488.1 Carbon-monoxide dehydrogenase (acceptor) [Sulfobacillus acidophilus DSM 10332]